MLGPVQKKKTLSEKLTESKAINKSQIKEETNSLNSDNVNRHS